MQAPVAIAVVAGENLVFELANPPYLRVVGDRDIVGKPVLEALPELRGQGYDDLLHNVMHTGEPVTASESLLKLEREGVLQDTYWTFIYAPLRNREGIADRVMAICNEVTEQVRARRRAIALADAGQEFASAPLDLDQVATVGARRAAEIVGDLCVMTVLEPNGERLRPVAVAHRDADAVAFAHRLMQEAPNTLGVGTVGRVAQTGQPVRVSSVDQAQIRAAIRPEYYPFIERFGIHSILIVPLRARDRVIGTLGLSRDQPGRPYTPEDQTFLQDLADRAALAIENARLYAGERDARAQAESAVRMRDQIMVALAHDLKTPLTAVRGYAQLAAREMRRAPQLRRATEAGELERIENDLRQIQAGTEMMARWLDQLGDAARLQIGEPVTLNCRPVNLVALVERVAAEQRQRLAEAERERLQVHAAVPEIVGEWDEARLERVLDNLIGNALKYSPQGGEVAVTVTRESRARADAHADSGNAADGAANAADGAPNGADGAPNGTDSGNLDAAPGAPHQAWAIVQVNDRGVGIPAADLPRVFEPFHRAVNVATAFAGTGIGLASARQIVVQHGGTISVESAEGKGSTFTVRLPLD
jgi:signal transduction histidine kinase